MSHVNIIDKGMEPCVRAFLEKINAVGHPLNRMSIDDARKALNRVQSVKVDKVPSDVIDTSIPGVYGSVSVRIVRPAGVCDLLPAVIYFHGGGWVIGDKNTHDKLMRDIANSTCAAVVFVDFTRSPEARFPFALEESYSVLEYIWKNGAALRIDSSRIAVAGDSAGGNMSTVLSMMAMDRQGPPISFQCLLYPVTDSDFNTQSYTELAEGYFLTQDAMMWFWDQYLPDIRSRKQTYASPLRAPIDQLKGLPPALILTAEFDVLRDEGEAYAHKLMDAGVQVTAIRYLGTIHDFVVLNSLANSIATRSAIDLACDMLRRAFSKG